MRALIFAPKNNEAKYTADATGAFQPGAKEFKKHHKIEEEIFLIENSKEPIKDTTSIKTKRRQDVINAINNSKDTYDVVAFFCHGTSTSLSSFYITTTHIPDFAKAICSRTKSDATILLYACSTGSKSTGFAATLANAINPNKGDNRKVYAHTSTGHSFAKADVIQFPIGKWVIDKTHKYWKKWFELMTHDQKYSKTSDWNLFWAKFPFMTGEALITELGGTVEWECWIKKPSLATSAKVHDGGIIGVYSTQEAANKEKALDNPWGNYECWVRKPSKAINAKTHISTIDNQNGIIGVFSTKEDANAEKIANTTVWSKP